MNNIFRNILILGLLFIGSLLYSQTVEENLTAKDFKGNDVLTGQSISLSDFKGKYVYLDFWGTWCKPCMEELPNIKSAYENMKHDNIVFIGIVTDEKSKLTKVLEKQQIGWYQIMNHEQNTNTDKNKKVKMPKFLVGFDQGINKDYQVNSWPTTFLINPDGEIIAKNLKGGERFIDELRNAIKNNELKVQH